MKRSYQLNPYLEQQISELYDVTRISYGVAFTHRDKHHFIHRIQEVEDKKFRLDCLLDRGHYRTVAITSNLDLAVRLFIKRHNQLRQPDDPEIKLDRQLERAFNAAVTSTKPKSSRKI